MTVRAPVFARSTTSCAAGAVGALCAASTTTRVSFEKRMLRTGTPARVALAMCEPPPSKSRPVIVTRVPAWPKAGVTVVKLASSTRVNLSSKVKVAPVSETTVMSTLLVSPGNAAAAPGRNKGWDGGAKEVIRNKQHRVKSMVKRRWPVLLLLCLRPCGSHSCCCLLLFWDRV